MQHKKTLYLGMLSGSLALPSLVFAAPESFKALISLFIAYVKLVIPIVMGLCVLFFFWGIVKYIFAAGDEAKRKESKNTMTWGLLALFFMVSILAIVALLGDAIFPGFTTRTETQYGPVEQTKIINDIQNEQDQRYREGTI